MNRIYRLVWCKSRNALVVASELSARNHGGVTASPLRSRTSRLLLVVLMNAGGLMFASNAFAQSAGATKLDDLQSLVNKYDAPVVGSSSDEAVAAPAASGLPAAESALSRVGQAVASALPSVHAGAHVATPVAQARVGAGLGRRGLGAGVAATVRASGLNGTVHGVTGAFSNVPVAGRLLGKVGNAVTAVTAAVPAVHVGAGVAVTAPSAAGALAATQGGEAPVSSRARALGIADGDGGGLPSVVGGAVDAASKLPVVGSTVASVGQTLGSAGSGHGDLGQALGKVVGGVVNKASTLPVVGSTVASVGQAAKSLTNGGSTGGGVAGQLGQVVGHVVDTASQLPVAGPVVAKVGQTLEETTAGIGQGGNGNGNGGGGGTPGHLLGGVLNTASKLPVVGSVVGAVGQTLAAAGPGQSPAASQVHADTLAAGQGGQGGGLPQRVVGGVIDTASKLPVAGPVVAKVGQALDSAGSGQGDLGQALGKVVGGVVNKASTLPVVGSTVASVGQAAKSLTNGGSMGGGVAGQLGQVVGHVVDTASQLPVAGPVVAKVGQTLQETTAGIGQDGSGNGNGGGQGAGQVVGAVLGDVKQAVGAVASTLSGIHAGAGAGAQGGSSATGAVSSTVAQVTGAVGKVAGTATGALQSTLSGLTSGLGGALDGSSGLLAQATDDSKKADADEATLLPDESGDGATSADTSTMTATALPMTLASTGSTAAASDAPATFAAAAAEPAGVPTVPAPSSTPSGLIIGNGGVVGTASQLLGSDENALFNNSDPDGYVTNGGLKVSSANFTQGYSTVNLLGIPLVNLTPVGTTLTTVDGTVLGGTGTDSHLTLIGGVTSGNYISNINNGANGGLLGVVLPDGAPAWASTCLNVLGIVKESCWAVNAAQDYQVLVGDGASANGSKEVVIGTNASHTLPTEDANDVFPGDGTNDPNNPSGVPTADYEARLGHSVVIGDDASGTANAQTILGAEATASAANSVALGYKSAADRGALANYTAYGLSAPQNSAGEVSIGAPGQERQITNVAPGSEDTDAVNVAQLKGVEATADNAVEYDDAGRGSVTLAGTASTDGGATGGTTISNLHQGALSATSTDAVNGSQLFATNSALAADMGGTASFDPSTNTWTAPTFSITSVGADGSTTTGDYDNVTDAFAAVDGSVNNLNTQIQNIDNGGGIKYFHANSTGTDADASGTDSVAVGPASVASGDGSMAMGSGATASADNAVAIGTGAVAQNGSAVSIGTGNTADGDGAVAMGDPNTATGQGAVALGYNNQASGQGAVALGSTSVANGASAVALGDSANASADQALALGAGATAANAGDVALGAGAVTDAPHSGTTALYGGTAAGTAGAVVSVGAAGQERQIQNVAPGVVSADSTDAVNGSQLYSVSAGVDNLGNSVASSLGGNSSYDASTGAVTAGLNYGGNSYDSVQDVVNAISGGGDTAGVKYFHANSTGTDAAADGTDSVAVGPASVASGDSSMAMGNGAQAGDDDAVAIGDGANASAANALAIGAGAAASMANSIALGAGSSTLVGALSDYTAYGLDAPQSSAGELNVGNRQITGVAAGSSDDDAVNVAQLKAVDEKAESTDKLAVKYDADADGNPTNTVTLAGDGSGAPVTITHLAAGAESADSTDAVNGSQLWHWTQDTTNQYSNYSLYQDIQNLPSGGGSVKYFNVNSTLGDSSATGSNSVAVGPQAKASGDGSVAMGNGATASGDNAVAIGAGSVADRDNTVSVGSSGHERQITNVAAGTEATDAVNVGQLDSAISTTTKGTVRYDTKSDGSIDYGNVTLGNGTGDTTIHNVAAGSAPTDAANVGQVTEAMDWSKTYTDQRFDQINGQLDRIGHRADAGVAAAMATAGLPQAYEPGRSMVAMSAGEFRGESSIAFGLSTISEGGRWVYKVAGSADTRGDAGVSIGAGMQW